MTEKGQQSHYCCTCAYRAAVISVSVAVNVKHLWLQTVYGGKDFRFKQVSFSASAKCMMGVGQ